MNTPVLSNTTAARDRIEAKINAGNTAALTVGAGGAMNFQNMTDMMEFAKLMSLSQVAVPKHLRENPGACLAVVIQASEWQMSPFAVANKSYSVNDRLAYESQLVSAVILRRAPIKSRFSYAFSGEGDSRRCTVSVTTTDDEVVSHTSPPFGLITPKNSPLWKSDPDQQLGFHTARSMCRRHFPDVLLGVYTMDELHDAPQERVAIGRVVRQPAQTSLPELAASFADMPEIHPEPDTPPPFKSPVEVSDQTERRQLLGAIRDWMAEIEIKTAKFAPLCRAAGLLESGTQIVDDKLPIESLRLIHDNRLAILEGTYNAA